jgi:hypothetical protein
MDTGQAQLALESVDVLPASITEVQDRFGWSMARIDGLNPPGLNAGLLLGTKRWMP